MSSSPSYPGRDGGRRDQIFPSLTEAQAGRVRRFGKERKLAVGDVLFSQGDRNLNFHVVLTGELEIVHPLPNGEERPVTVHKPLEFTGEASLLTGRRSLVTGRATTEVTLLEVAPAKFRELVESDAELSELLMRAFILRRTALINSHFGDAVVVGSRFSAATLRLQEFFTRNGQPYTYLDADQDKSVQALLDGFDLKITEIPVVICMGSRVLKNPSNEEVAQCLELNVAIDTERVRDVIVIGAGPAGLAAAVYAGSEGLSVLVVESDAPGGQAGTSSRIENYLGFPTGISGGELAARAFAQAEKFGAEIAVACAVQKLNCDRHPYRLQLSHGNFVSGRTVVFATGAEYRNPDIENRARFEGAGVYHCATALEGQRCSGEEVIVVGGANSAGQAAVFLARTASKVTMMVRRGGLADTMSRYLISRIEQTVNIQVCTHSQLTAFSGESHLEKVTWEHLESGKRETKALRHVFLMTGASPNTAWAKDCVTLDEKGFVKTGGDLTPEELHAARWPLARPPHSLETSLPGIFAVGDVRSGSVKRVAAAVGEGSGCVQLIHRVLAEGAAS